MVAKLLELQAKLLELQAKSLFRKSVLNLPHVVK